MIGEGGIPVDTRAAALVGGCRDAPAGVAAWVLPGGYGRKGGMTVGEWFAVVWSSFVWPLSGLDTDILSG
jgi:hypothetical protein